MNPKRELSSVDLRALVGELSSQPAGSVRKAYLYEDRLVRFRLRDRDRGRRELLVEVGEDKRLCFADPQTVPDAPSRPPNFAKMLRNRLQGAELVEIAQHEFDRIVRLEFERGDGRTTVIGELFGDGNVVVLDGSGTVIDCLEPIRLKSREVVPGRPYEFPDARVDPFSLSAEAFLARMRDSSSDVIRTLATQLNFGGDWAEELCTRATVPKELAVEEATDDQLEAVFAVVSELQARLEEGRLDPRLYEQDGDPVDVTPVPMEEYSALESRGFESFNAAVATYFHERSASRDDSGQAEQTQGPDVDDQIDEYQRIIDHQERAVQDFEEQAEQERQRAERLYANYDLVDPLLTTIGDALEDGFSWDEIEERIDATDPASVPAIEAIKRFDPGANRVVIELDGLEVPCDPTVGVEHNADRLYQEGKRIEEKREGALEAIERTKADLEDAKARAQEPDTTADSSSEQPVDWLERSSIPVRQPEDWYERFRWFHSSDDFLILGGRSAKQNEELVSKYLEPVDRFVHAQAHGGPVTIIKATDPSEPAREVDFPTRTLEEAARFAISYSSVWKAGQFSGDAYLVDPDQVTKTPASGEYLDTGAFAIQGERTYFENLPVGVAVGITCEPVTRVIGGPPEPIRARSELAFELEPGSIARSDIAKRLYRKFREAFRDTSFVRQVASPESIAEVLPSGGSRIRED